MLVFNLPSYLGPFPALTTFQVAEDFALPAATASFSLRFTAPLLAAEHFRLLAVTCGTVYHRICGASVHESRICTWFIGRMRPK